MEQKEDLLDVLKIFFKWLKPIAWLCLGVGLGTAIISLFLPNYYESVTTFYVASVDQAKPGQIFGTSTRDIDFYGDDRDNDRLMTIAESGELAEYIIEKFDLYKHYDINPAAERAAFKVKEKFFKHYTVMKTKRDAIELSVEDKDKERAAAMVNAVRNRVDEVFVKVIRGQLSALKKTLNKNIQEKGLILKEINDSLIVLRNKYGIYNIESQGEVFADQILSTEANLARATARLEILRTTKSTPADTLALLKATVAGYKNGLDNLKTKLKSFNEGHSSVLVLERQQKEMSNKLSEEKVQLNKLETAYDSDISAINLIEAGAVPVIKSRPKRSLIVLSAMLTTFIFSFIGLLLFESYRHVNWKEIIKGESVKMPKKHRN